MNKKFILKKTYDIEKLISKKQSVGNKFYAIYYNYVEEKELQLAISVSRRYKTAVKKNYEKRVTKEILRKHLEKLENLEMLVVVKEGAGALSFEEKEKQILYLINLIRRKNEERK